MLRQADRVQGQKSIFQQACLSGSRFLFIWNPAHSFFCLFAISWADPEAYGGSQARGLIGAVATGLRQSHSNLGSKPRLQPTAQLTATPDPQPTEQGQGPNPQPHGSQLDSLTTAPQQELLKVIIDMYVLIAIVLMALDLFLLLFFLLFFSCSLLLWFDDYL